jgi:hypothetical protein
MCVLGREFNVCPPHVVPIFTICLVQVARVRA